MPKPSQGYGGKFGVQTDRIDKVILFYFIYQCLFSSVQPVLITKERLSLIHHRKIILVVLVVRSVLKQTEWTNQLLAGIVANNYNNMKARKVLDILLILNFIFKLTTSRLQKRLWRPIRYSSWSKRQVSCWLGRTWTATKTWKPKRFQKSPLIIICF